MRTFAIIVIYNGMQRNWIEKCFSSIRKSTVPVQIIAVDNYSSDNSVSFIKKNFPEVILLESAENLGFGGANNLGLKKALELGGDYFFLLNQDAWVEENTIELLLKYSQENPEFGIVSPLQLNGLGTALDYNFSTYITPNRCKNLYSDFALDKIKNKIYESGVICAAAWMLSKNCLKKVGGFSPTFFHYAEDDNYVHRLTSKGMKIGVLPFVKIFHDREQREITAFHQPMEYKKRALLLKFSNPMHKEDLGKYIKILKFKKKKMILQLQFSSGKKFEDEIKFLEKNRELILKNRNLSLSPNEYIFL